MVAARTVRFSLCVAVLMAAAGVRAERLPVTTYTMREGLPHDHVIAIVPDSRGFLWFGTREGLARFDGHQFVRYDVPGLAGRSVYDLVEDGAGGRWVGTSSGLIHLDDQRRETLLTPIRGKIVAVYSIAREATGRIWCATSAGLFSFHPPTRQFRHTDLGLPTDNTYAAQINALLPDPDGSLWVGTFGGLYRLRPDGQAQRITTDNVQALARDRNGHLWAGTTLGLCQIARDGRVARYKTADGLAADGVMALLAASDGTLWVGTSRGLSRLDSGASRLRSFTSSAGVTDKQIGALAEDREGNIWIGTDSGGAIEIVRRGLVTYLEQDGLVDSRIASILEDRQGNLCVISGHGTVHTFDGKQFTATRANLPASLRNYGWGWNQTWFQDHNGEWWVPTGEGLFRFPRAMHPSELARSRPLAVYTKRDGLFTSEIFRLFEDSRGDVWIGVVGQPFAALCRWERTTGRIHRYSDRRYLPEAAASAFAEDAAGNLWIGFYEGELLRYRNGRFQKFSPADGIRAGTIRALHRDRNGALWVATSRGGAARIDDAAGERPRFIRYGMARGLASEQVLSIAEDLDGRLYFGTGRGVDQLDPRTGNIRHFTAADGLPNNLVNVAYRDRLGFIWFGTLAGLARFDPRTAAFAAKPPAVYIGGLRIAGKPRRLSDAGVLQATNLELGPHENHIEIDFVSPGFRSGEATRYQYLLEGSDAGWSAPRTQRSVTYATLAPGKYRFAVRAIDANGTMSDRPATLAFAIAPPVWRRWWFVTSVAVLIAAMTHAFYRIRLRRLVDLERVRTRIASDLHDDIGASLSRMAILSEVVKREISPSDAETSLNVAQIADSARGLVDSMSDIVWSVDPHHDDLRSLILRIREFASDVLERKGITWTLETPQLDSIALTPEQRRDLYLLFKEAIHNIATHSHCRSAFLKMEIDHRQLVAEICDDGRGFDAAGEGNHGHGLSSMRRRAAHLKGRLEIDSRPGETRLRLSMPLGSRA
jgi:ligand-binding sensor domain-containing protein/signal transduction histidine kinase